MKNTTNFNKIKIIGINTYTAEGLLELEFNKTKISYRTFELVGIIINPVYINISFSQSFN
jgi:hypothetical protein